MSESDALMLLGDGLYGPLPVHAFGLKQDAEVRGILPDHVELIDMQQWVELLNKFDRWITC